MLLRKCVEKHSLHRPLAAGTIRNLEATVALYERWAGRDCDSEKLTDESASLFVAWMEKQGYAYETMLAHRGNLLTIWNTAADNKWAARPDGRMVRKPTGERPLPQSLSIDQAHSLLLSCDKLKGTPQGCEIPTRGLMRMWVLISWDCGLRPWCDQLRLERRWITEEGLLVMRQSKTKWPIICRLRDETMEAIGETFPPDRELLFPVSYKTIRYNWEKIRRLACVNASPKKMRVTRATMAEWMEPGSAPRALGHKPGSNVAYERYVDPVKSTNPDRIPMAPRLSSIRLHRPGTEAG